MILLALRLSVPPDPPQILDPSDVIMMVAAIAVVALVFAITRTPRQRP